MYEAEKQNHWHENKVIQKFIIEIASLKFSLKKNLQIQK